MLARTRFMTPSTVGKAAVWTAAISLSAVHPHEALIAFGAAVAKEVFDLVHARMHRTSVLAYLRTARTETTLRIGPSSAAPALALSNASPRSRRPDGEEGAAPVPADDDLPSVDYGSDPDTFCIGQRQDWLAYAMTRTRSWSDAEDAVSHVVEKIYEHYAEHGTVCPDMRDPVGWSKTVIRNYLIDRWRRSGTERRRSGAFALPEEDIADDITDQIIAGKALAFVESLDDQSHMIAMMAWVDGLKPKEIAEQLDMKDLTVRKSLYQTRKKMRAELGVAEPQRILRKETT